MLEDIIQQGEQRSKTKKYCQKTIIQAEKISVLVPVTGLYVYTRQKVEIGNDSYSG